MSDERDEIRSRIDIVELVGGRVALRRAGKVFKGLCPFHDDRTPSFTVDPATGRYRCWSCGEAGDCFTWVMKTGHVEFPEALKELAIKAGVEIKNRGASAPPGQREAHKAAMAEALAFFRETLPRNAEATAYLERRGIDAATVETWEMGFAPDSGEALVGHLKRKGYSLAECKSLFLIDERDRGGFYDKFRGRLMFPIRDERGELVAFGGRLLGDGQPKYINSSDTPLYRKSRVLYGFNRARDRIAKDRGAVLVEGYLDVIACHRADVTTAVASLGTALSEEHAKLLKRWADEVTILYDADAAGQKAAERAVGLLRAEGLRVRVALMPPGEDPDTLLKKAGGAAVRRAVEGGLSPLDFAVGQLEARSKPEDEAFWEELVGLLAAAPASLEIERHLHRFSALYPGLRDPVAARKRLESMIEARKPTPQIQRRERTNPAPIEHPELAATPMTEPLNGAEYCLFRALHEPDFRRIAWMFSRMESILMTGTAIGLSRAIQQTFPDSPPEGTLAVWLARLPEPQRTIMADLRQDFRGENINEAQLADSIEWLKRRKAIRDLQRRRRGDISLDERQNIHLANKELNPDAKAAEVSEDEDPFA